MTKAIHGSFLLSLDEVLQEIKSVIILQVWDIKTQQTVIQTHAESSIA